MAVALILGAGTDEELQAHAPFLFHGTLAVVVIVQDQAVQLLSRVVAHRIKGDVVIFLPPCTGKAQSFIKFGLRRLPLSTNTNLHVQHRK